MIRKHPNFAGLRKQRGQSLVEMAVTLVILLWVLAAALNYGMAYLTYVTIRDAAQEGATYGSLYPTDLGGIAERVQQSAPILVPVDLSGVTPEVDTPDGICPGKTLRVTIHYDFQLLIPFVDIFIDNPIPLRAYSTSEILRRVDPSCPSY